MTKSEFKVLVTTMKIAYPTFTSFIPDAMAMSVWYRLLEDVSAEDANEAFTYYVKDNKYPPTIADLRWRHEQRLEQERDDMEYVRQYFDTVWNKYYHPATECEADVRKEYYAACRDYTIENRFVCRVDYAKSICEGMERHFRECHETGEHDFPMVRWVRAWRNVNNDTHQR